MHALLAKGNLMQIHRLLAVSAAATLATGCAMPPEGGAGAMGPGMRAGSGMEPGMGSGMGSGMGRGGPGGAGMDMDGMCAMHRQMTAGKSPAEQQAAVQSHIRSMHGSASPDMVTHHMKMMEMHCPAAKP